jgi:3-oxoacyl-(acyl-carrier-protein) synthase
MIERTQRTHEPWRAPYFALFSTQSAYHHDLWSSHSGFKADIVIATAPHHRLHAIGLSARMIEYGDCDVMVAGGAEATVSPGYRGFAASALLLGTGP